MADRRNIVAKTALITAFAAVGTSIWYFSLNPRVNEVVRLDSDKSMLDLENLSMLEVYLYLYSCWGGPAFFVFLIIWLDIAVGKRHPERRPFPGPLIWWVSVVLFALYVPTILLPLSVIGLWALFTPETKHLIQTPPYQTHSQLPGDVSDV